MFGRTPQGAHPGSGPQFRKIVHFTLSRGDVWHDMKKLVVASRCRWVPNLFIDLGHDCGVVGTLRAWLSNWASILGRRLRSEAAYIYAESSSLGKRAVKAFDFLKGF